MLYGALVSQQPSSPKPIDAAARSALPVRWYAMARQQALPFGLGSAKPLQVAGRKGSAKGRP